MRTFDAAVSTKCDPDGGSCQCLKTWLDVDACKVLEEQFSAPNPGRKKVTIEVNPQFWLADETPAGMYDCPHSLCNVRHGADYSSGVAEKCIHARFEKSLGVQLAEEEGAVLVHTAVAGGAAEQQGVKNGMKVKKVEGDAVFTIQQALQAFKSAAKPFAVEFCEVVEFDGDTEGEPDAYVFDGCKDVADTKNLRWPKKALTKAADSSRMNVAIIMENMIRFFDSKEAYTSRLETLFWGHTDMVMGHYPPQVLPHAKKAWLGVSYLDLSEEAFRSPPLAFAEKTSGVAWFSSQCDKTYAPKRLELVDQLRGLLHVDAFGKCRHNAEIEEKLPQCSPKLLKWVDVNQDPSKECVFWNYKVRSLRAYSLEY
jgi:hypothetical protein